MKSEKGITLTSLVLYILVATVVISTMAIISGHAFSNIKTLAYQADYAIEYNKFNMFFIQDIKNNKSAETTSTQIIFEDGNIYEYKENAIYRNETKIAENVLSCVFSPSTYTVKNTIKNIITVNLKVGKHNKTYQKQIEYVLKYW